jgi:hypothetical protein
MECAFWTFSILRKREENRRKLAETEKRDASA